MPVSWARSLRLRSPLNPDRTRTPPEVGHGIGALACQLARDRMAVPTRHVDAHSALQD